MSVIHPRRLMRGLPVVALSLLLPAAALASGSTTNFESGYAAGSVNGQNGWSSTGPYDQEVVVNGANAPASFGSKSLRISNAVTAGSFGDQTFAPALLSEAAGEPTATFGSFPTVPLKPYLEVSFDVAAFVPGYQPGLRMTFSPDRGDGSRMSFVRVVDTPTGLSMRFIDVQGMNAGSANFVETEIASGLSRTTRHTVKFAMTFVPGPSNDTVKVFIDGNLAIIGTSWEDYYRFDPEAVAEQSVRATRTLLIRSSGPAAPTVLGEGFLVDNVSLQAGSGLPTAKAQCKGAGWEQFDFPRTFANQGDCVQFVKTGK